MQWSSLQYSVSKFTPKKFDEINCIIGVVDCNFQAELKNPCKLYNFLQDNSVNFCKKHKNL